MQKEEPSHLVTLLSDTLPVVNSTGSEVCVEYSDDGRRRVSQNGIVDDIQKINQLKRTIEHLLREANIIVASRLKATPLLCAPYL